MADNMFPVYPGFNNNDHACLANLINLNALSSGFSHVAQEVGNSSQSTLGAIGSSTESNLNATWKATNDVINAVTQHGLRNNDAINSGVQNTQNTIHASSQRLADTINSGILANQAGHNMLSSEICNVRGDIKDEGRLNEKGFGDTRDAVRTEGRLNEKGFSETQNVVQHEGRHIERSICDGFARTNENLFKENQEVKMQIQNTLHSLTLQNQANAAAAAKQLSECCCELKVGQQDIKNTILAEACKGREEALKRELDAAQRALQLLQINVGNVSGPLRA